MHSLTKCIDSYGEASIELVRGCLQFVHLQHIRQKLIREALWNQSYKAFLERFLKLIRKFPAIVEDKALFANFHYLFWEAQHIVLPQFRHLIGSDPFVLANNLHLSYSAVFKSPQDEKKAILGLKYDFDHLYAYNTTTIQVVLKTVEVLIRDKKTNKIGNIKQTNNTYNNSYIILKSIYEYLGKDYLLN